MSIENIDSDAVLFEGMFFEWNVNIQSTFELSFVNIWNETVQIWKALSNQSGH